MNKIEFLANFAEQFEDTDSNEIQFETKFHDLEEWSSLVGMMLIAMAKVSYDKVISGEELKKCITVEDVYNLINSK
ncbi:MAG: acyl carrier protein [Bacteroidales bacterium]|nr:acyl carrier protein [Bacteroidales bacterium]